jgi:hypothetical protein
MEKEFVPYPLALRMKELGYDEPCFGWFGVDVGLIVDIGCKNSTHVLQYVVSAPTWRSAFNWFTRKYGIEGFIHKAIEGTYYFVIKKIGNNEDNMYEFTKSAPKQFDTHEEAELACLEKLIEIAESIKEKENEDNK